MDTVKYIFYKNPVVTNSVDAVKYLAKSASTTVGFQSGNKLENPTILTKSDIWKIMEFNRGFIRIAGILGAAAVAFGAYGAHSAALQDEHKRRIFETANRYHFFHSLALIGVPFCRFPKVSGLLLICGILIFSGTCYYESITGEVKYRKFTPLGGSLLIISWISFIL